MGAGKVGKGTKMERKTLLKGLQLPVNEMDEIVLMGIPSQLGVRIRRRLSFLHFTITSCSQLLLDRPF